jgi:hypothetical protein
MSWRGVPSTTRRQLALDKPSRRWRGRLGHSAGHDGGLVVFAGTPADLVAARFTLTGAHPAAYVGS